MSIMDTSLTDVTWLSGSECTHLKSPYDGSYYGNRRGNTVVAAPSTCKSGNENFKPKQSISCHKRPVMTYSNLIMEALKINQAITQFQICQWVSHHYPYYDIEDRSWQRAIKQSLRRNSMFMSSNEVDNNYDNNPLWMLAECYQDNMNLVIKQKIQNMEQNNSHQLASESKKRKEMYAPIMIDPYKREVICNQQRVKIHAFAEVLRQNPLQQDGNSQNNKRIILPKELGSNDHSYSLENKTQKTVVEFNGNLHTDQCKQDLDSNMESSFQSDNNSNNDNTSFVSTNNNNANDANTSINVNNNTSFASPVANTINNLSTNDSHFIISTSCNPQSDNAIENTTTNDNAIITTTDAHNTSIPFPSIEHFFTQTTTEYPDISTPTFVNTSTPGSNFHNDDIIDWKQFLATPSADRPWNTTDDLLFKSPNSATNEINLTATPHRKSTIRRSLSLDSSF